MRRRALIAPLVVLSVLLAAGAPETGLQGGAGGGNFTNAAGYNYPAVGTECIAVGDEAVPSDKDFEACPNVPVWSQHGYDGPIANPKWHTGFFIAHNYDPGQSVELAVNLQSAAPTGIGTTNMHLVGIPTDESNAVRGGNWSIRVAQLTGVTDADDTCTVSLYCCPETAANFAACTNWATLVTINPAFSATVPEPVTGAFGAEDTAAAGTCDYLVLGTVSGADGAPSANSMTNFKFTATIEYEN